MSPEKQQILFDRYPALFRERMLPNTQTLMCYGIDVQGDGWFNLIDAMCARIDAIQRVLPGLDFTFQQIKSKFGGLRAYRGVIDLNGADEVWGGIIDAIISKAEQDSLDTCEVTGDWGRPYCSPAGWVRTLNPAAAKELGFMEREEFSKYLEECEAKRAKEPSQI
jgi:hypothetical protein